MKIKNNYYYLLIPLIIIFSNIIAYYVCLNSIKVVYGFSSIFTKFLYDISVILNSLIFPFLLLLIIYIFRNIFLILILHIFSLTILLTCLIYYKYFQTIPHINIIRQIYVLPSVINQIFFQAIGINELIISGCIFLSMGFSFKLSNGIRKINLI